jgi:hypothetical protein
MNITRTLRRLIVTVALAGCALAMTGTAFAASIPYHHDYGAKCYFSQYTGATVDAYAPDDMRSVSGAQEAVYWRADLWKNTSSGWLPANQSKPWLQAQATGTGLIRTMFNGFVTIWSEYPSGLARSTMPFTNLTVGQYAVKETYLWSNGATTTQWQNMNNGTTQICTVS